MSAELIEHLFLPAYGAAADAQLGDSAVIEVGDTRLAFSTDSYVVKPMFFPGGSIGDLAVNGTVNDLAMSGADSAVPVDGLHHRGGHRADRAWPGRGGGGCGRAQGRSQARHRGHQGRRQRKRRWRVHQHRRDRGVDADIDIRPERATVGDVVIVSGDIGVHGVAVMSCREGLEFGTKVRSDSAPLHGLVAAMLATGVDIHVLRDPTRGGVAASLNEIAKASKVGFSLVERDLPIPQTVEDACGLLGLDPLYVANEGKLVAIVPAQDADLVLDAMRAHEYGLGALRHRGLRRGASRHGRRTDRAGGHPRRRPADR